MEKRKICGYTVGAFALGLASATAVYNELDNTQEQENQKYNTMTYDIKSVVPVEENERSVRPELSDEVTEDF